MAGSFDNYQVLYAPNAPAEDIRLGQLFVDESEATPLDMLKICTSLGPPVYTSLTDGIVALMPVPANPTASVGLTAVNGTAVTYMRSDAAPALSQGITPTWSGTHTFTPQARFTGGLLSDTTISIDSAAAAVVDLRGTASRVNFHDDDQAADEGRWRMDNNGLGITIESISDNGASTRNVLTATRTGGSGVAVTAINIGNTTDLPRISLRGAQVETEAGADIAAPDWTWRTDTDLGIYRVGANSAALVSNSASRFGWNATGVGFNGQTPIARPDYTITNPTTNRSIDVSAATLAQLRQVVGTMIQDLIDYGLYQ